MGDVSTTVQPVEFYLRPEDLLIDERYARLWVGDEEHEAQEIERLGDLISEMKQINAALVKPSKEEPGKYVLFAGHRRRRAIIRANEKRNSSGKELLKIRVRLVTEGDIDRMAQIDNITREDYSPMELALRINRLRTERKWQGFGGTKKIAAYLGLHTSSVTQYEKFLSMSPAVQQQLGNGTISAQSVLDMIKADVSEHEQAPVLQRAAEIQKTEDSKLSKRAKERREQKKANVERVERPAVAKAIREVKGEKSAVSLTRKEVLESLEAFDSPAYGHADGAARTFITYFVGDFAAGKGKVAVMRKKFGVMVARAPKGSPSSNPQPPAETKKKTKTTK